MTMSWLPTARLVALGLLLTACAPPQKAPTNVASRVESTAPDSCAGDLFATVHNYDRRSVEVNTGRIPLGVVGGGSVQKFAVPFGNRVWLNPAPWRRGESYRYVVYTCER